MKNVLTISSPASSRAVLKHAVGALQQLLEGAELASGYLVKVWVSPPDVPATLIICPARVADNVRELLGEPLHTPDGYRFGFNIQGNLTSQAYAPAGITLALELLLEYSQQLLDTTEALLAQTSPVVLGGNQAGV